MVIDPHLRPGAVIDVANEMSPMTRRRFYEIAAAIAEHIAQTHVPREQRIQDIAAGRSEVSQQTRSVRRPAPCMCWTCQHVSA